MPYGYCRSASYGISSSSVMDGYKLLGGIAFLGFGIWLLIVAIREIKTGYEDRFGSNVKIYFASIISIVAGLAVIYQGVF